MVVDLILPLLMKAEQMAVLAAVVERACRLHLQMVQRELETLRLFLHLKEIMEEQRGITFLAVAVGVPAQQDQTEQHPLVLAEMAVTAPHQPLAVHL